MTVVTRPLRLEDYPAASWRPNQRHFAEAIRACAAAPGERRLGLEGPCGSGKSIGVLRACFDPATPPSNVLSTTRHHLQQYEDTLRRDWGALEDRPGGWVVLRGRSHYACCAGQTDHRRTARHAARMATAAPDDPAAPWVGSSKCPAGDRCLYQAALRAAADAQVVLQCTIGFLYRQRYWAALGEDDPRRRIVARELVVLDEAHEYLAVRRSFETTKVRMQPERWDPAFLAAIDQARQRGRFRAGYLLLSDGPDQYAQYLRSVFQAELGAPARARVAAEATERTHDPRKVAEAVQAHVERHERLVSMVTAPTDPDAPRPVVSLQWTRDALGHEHVDLVAEPLYAAVGAPLARVEVFTSATLAPVARLLRLEGLLHRYPAIFPASNVTANPLPDPNPGSRVNAPMAPELLQQIHAAPGRPLTIALFVSRAHAQSASAALHPCDGVWCQGRDGSLAECIERATAHRGPTAAMLVCYGGWVGTDVPGDKWLVLGSAPRSPLAPHHEARAARRPGGGSPWTDPEKLALDRLQLAQGLGRALRTPTDRAVVIWQKTTAFDELGLRPDGQLSL